MMPIKNCLLIAGEKSGEEHALSFFPELRERCADFHFWGVGGDDLQKQGMELVYHLNDFSSWGISEVLLQIPFYLKALKHIEQQCVERGTQVAILIDFQTFNLKLAERLKKRGIKVLYYVAPQAWAWKAWRAKTLEQCVHTLFTIIPFEKDWFKARGVSRIRGVDHPLWRHYRQAVEALPAEKKIHLEKINILLLPGSRRFEVQSLLPDFCQTIEQLKGKYNIQVSVVCSPSVKAEIYQPYLKDYQIYQSEELATALAQADLCLAASGTVTLACALFQLPTLVCYKTSWLNEIIFKLFVRYTGFISLANIVHEKKIFPEILQEKVIPDSLAQQLSSWIDRPELYDQMIQELRQTPLKIQGELKEVAQYMEEVLRS